MTCWERPQGALECGSGAAAFHDIAIIEHLKGQFHCRTPRASPPNISNYGFSWNFVPGLKISFH